MDGFNNTERLTALKSAKVQMELELEIFKKEQIEAFHIVSILDEEILTSANNNPQLIEKRRQKFVWASGLKWNIIGQEKEIKNCEKAIENEERALLKSTLNVLSTQLTKM